jgi:hypothetical protein
VGCKRGLSRTALSLDECDTSSSFLKNVIENVSEHGRLPLSPDKHCSGLRRTLMALHFHRGIMRCSGRRINDVSRRDGGGD